MAIKILTKNGVENTNIDGARDCNFNAGGRSGIVKGALNECRLFASSSNAISMNTGELRLSGHRILIENIQTQTLVNIPIENVRYSYVAQIVIDNLSNPVVSFIIQDANSNLIQENLFNSEVGNGTYQLEIGKFTLTKNGQVEDAVTTADLINGGVGGGGEEYIRIGKVTAIGLASNLEPEVDIENVVDSISNKLETNFTFSIPKGDKGEQGIQGVQGIQGIPGAKGDKGDTGGVSTEELNAKTSVSLGAYDTYTYNSTTKIYTVTRQTQYIDSSYILEHGITTDWLSTLNGLFGIKLDTLSTNEGINVVVNNLKNYSGDLAINNTVYGISTNIYDGGTLLRGRIEGYTTEEQILTYLSSYPIFIQFKSKTSHIETYNERGFARTGQPYIEEWKKTEADRSSNLLNIDDYNYSDSGITVTVSGNVVTINGTVASTNQTVNLPTNLSSLSTSKLYTCSVLPLSGSYSGQTSYSGISAGLHSNDYSYQEWVSLNGSDSESMVPISGLNFGILFYKASGTVFNNYSFVIMFNAGSVALPYQPYEGKVVHEKQLREICVTKEKSFELVAIASGRTPIIDLGLAEGTKVLIVANNNSPYITFDEASGGWQKVDTTRLSPITAVIGAVIPGTTPVGGNYNFQGISISYGYSTVDTATKTVCKVLDCKIYRYGE